MLEKLKSEGRAFGFRVAGRVTAEEVEAFLPQVESAIREHGKHPIGILADLSGMRGAEWKARWDEIRFLARYGEHIARVALVGAGKWEDVKAEVLAGTVLVQAETRYYPASEIEHAWHWVKTGTPGAGAGRTILPKGTLMAGYVPEYMDV
jgi:SpoIIAA-like